MDIAELGFRVDTGDLTKGERGLKKLGAAAETTERQATGVGSAVRRSGAQAQAASGQYRLAAGSVGNLTAQFNDIGVMLAAGQSPLQLALQQGTQISQVFGNAGAGQAVRGLGAAFASMVSPVNLLTIGTIAAGAAAFQMVQGLMSAGDEAKEAGEGVKDFTDALDAYQNYADTAQSSTDDLREKFGQFAEEIRANAQYMAKVTANQAIGDLDSSDFTAGLDDAIGRIEKFREVAAQSQDAIGTSFGSSSVLAGLKQNAADAAASIGLTISEVDSLNEAINAFDGATSMKDIADRAGDVIATIRSMTDGSARMSGQLAQALDLFTRVQNTAASASVTMEDLGGDAASFSIGLSEAQRWARDTLVELREQGAEQQAINGYVTKGLSLTEARAAAERDAFAEQVRSRDVSAETADELLRAYDAANSVADAASGIDFSWAAQQAADLAAQIERSVSATMSLASQGRAALRQSEIRLENKGDPVATAGALARDRLPDISGVDPILRDQMRAEQDAIVEMAEQEARNQQQFREWQESQRAAARSSRGGSGGRSGRGGKSEAEKLADKEQREGEREAERIRDDLTQATRDAMSITERYAAEVADLRELEEEGYLTTQEFARARAMLGEQMQAEQFEPMRQGVEDFSRAMSDAIVMGDSLRDNLAGVFQGIASDLVTSGIQQAMGQAFGGAQGGGGLFGGILSAFGGGGVSNGAGGAISNALGGAIAGARADGGPVTGGRNYLVGERGPEIFQPGSSGHIVPNDQIGGGQGVNINFAPQIDARGADQKAVDRIEANMRRMQAELPNQIRSTLRQDGNQGRARKVMR